MLADRANFLNYLTVDRQRMSVETGRIVQNDMATQKNWLFILRFNETHLHDVNLT